MFTRAAVLEQSYSSMDVKRLKDTTAVFPGKWLGAPVAVKVVRLPLRVQEHADGTQPTPVSPICRHVAHPNLVSHHLPANEHPLHRIATHVTASLQMALAAALSISEPALWGNGSGVREGQPLLIKLQIVPEILTMMSLQEGLSLLGCSTRCCISSAAGTPA